MTSRRAFIQILAAIPPALSFRRAWAAPDPSRLALIIGNSSYQDAPLVNPANDAKAVGRLFTQAGFTVDSQLNATRADMMAAIERFGAAAKRTDTKLVVFYYAGHGAQLDWRNYLLPVDAVVQKQEHMKERCVDLNLLLGQLSAAKDKTFIIILDACRNNPFGASYRPEHKGLSQFDAPVGSLLAYATSPGNVASDGEGANGLYTEHLVRELGKRETRIEDALKRVRLNVRLASNGAQIPWETTSLESDIFIFDDGRKKLSETELEQLAEADIAEWARIKSSKKMDDWVGYLRNFPNGRFAEIAQMRLTRHLAEVERLALEEKQREELQRKEEQQKLAEQKRLDDERIERERIRIVEEQRLAAAQRQREEQQLLERKRQDERQSLEARRRLEAQRQERERQRIAEAERLASERKRDEELRLIAEQKLLDQQRMERERQDQLELKRLAAELQRIEEDKRRANQQQAPLARTEPAQTAKPVSSQPTSAATTATEPAPGPTVNPDPKIVRQPGRPQIMIGEGNPVPQLIAPSTNPFSAGRYQLGRVFTVGDRATYRQSDLLTGIEERTYSRRVTRVDYDEDQVEFNNGQGISDLMGNDIKSGTAQYESPVQFVPAELQVGKKWTAAFVRTKKDRMTNGYYEFQIVKRESITVPAGSFDTFRIEGVGWNNSEGTLLELRLWLVPGLNFPVKREFVTRRRSLKFIKTELHELVSLRQFARGRI